MPARGGRALGYSQSRIAGHTRHQRSAANASSRLRHSEPSREALRRVHRAPHRRRSSGQDRRRISPGHRRFRALPRPRTVRASTSHSGVRWRERDPGFEPDRHRPFRWRTSQPRKATCASSAHRGLPRDRHPWQWHKPDQVRCSWDPASSRESRQAAVLDLGAENSNSILKIQSVSQKSYVETGIELRPGR